MSGQGAHRQGIADRVGLRHRFEKCRSRAANGTVLVETDLCACANPERMRRIGEAAEYPNCNP